MQDTPPDTTYLVLAIVVGFFVVFPLFWSAVVFVLGAMSGWRDLSGRYRWEGPFPPNAHHMVRGRMGWTNYNGILSVGADEHFLYLGVMVMFRPGHPQLRIPLEGVRVSPTSGFFGKRVRLDIGDIASLKIPARVWDDIRGGSGV